MAKDTRDRSDPPIAENANSSAAGDAIADFVSITDNETNSYLYVDADGTGGSTWIATLLGTTGLDPVETLVLNNHLKVEASV